MRLEGRRVVRGGVRGRVARVARGLGRVLGEQDEVVEDLGLEVFAVLDDAGVLDGDVAAALEGGGLVVVGAVVVWWGFGLGFLEDGSWWCCHGG